MKLVILTDACQETLNILATTTFMAGAKYKYTASYTLDERKEFKKIINNIKEFSSSPVSQVLLVKFTGRESVYKELSDTLSEMIFFFSTNKNSGHYIENVPNTFLDLILTFAKGD